MHFPGPLIEKATAPDAAEGARDGLGQRPGRVVSGRPEPLARPDHMMVDPQARAQRLGGGERGGAVPLDSLIDADRHNVDVGPPPEVPFGDPKSDRGVFPAREGHGDRSPGEPGELTVQFAPRALVDRRAKLGSAQVTPRVRLVDDRGLSTSVAAHDRLYGQPAI